MSRAHSVLTAPALLACVLLAPGGAAAAEPGESTGADDQLIEAMFLIDEHLRLETAVASHKSVSARESPGIVSIITREQIVELGARDLVDVLLLVPGLHFGVDVGGVVGIGVRGHWGHEGKVLLLVDGQEMNEILFSTTQFGHELPVDQIERIEVIRGPGSVIYGGFAELAVVNVITRAGGDFEGVAASASYGQLARSFARANASVALGRNLGDLRLGFVGFAGQGNRSDREFTDLYGGTVDMAKSSELNPRFFSLGATFKKLKAQVVVHDQRTTQQTSYDVVLPEPVHESFTSYFADTSVELELGKGATLTPRFTYKRQEPWRVTDIADRSDVNFYEKTAERITGSLMAAFEPSEQLHLLTGVVGSWDHARVGALTPPERFFTDGATSVSYSSVGALAEADVSTSIANFTAGARVENHSVSGASLLPRAAITKLIDPWHFKLLYARAFRAPGIENLDFTPGIKPELTDVIEAEAGYRITEQMFLVLNVFDVTIHDPIVYFFDEFGESYINDVDAGTRGVELEYRVAGSLGHATLGYSYYRVAGDGGPAAYSTGRDDVFLAFPAHKATLSGSIKLLEKLSLGPSLIFTSERFTYVALDENEEGVLGSLDPAVLINVFLLYRDAFTPGLDFGLGGYDLLDHGLIFPQPHASLHAPLPGPGREVMLRVSYAR